MKNTTITTPGKTRTISKTDPLIDVICEHTGWNPDLLDDPAGVRQVREATADPAWCADSFNAGDRLREYLDLTEQETVTLDVDSILNTPINERYAHESHYHGLEYVEPHRSTTSPLRTRLVPAQQ